MDALQKENFNLQLENHFLKERLASMAPDHIESALKENVKLKIEILNLGKELKKSKKLLVQQDRDLAAAARERDGHKVKARDAESRELEAMWREEKERRIAAEDELDKLKDDQFDRAQELEDRVRNLEEELERAKDDLDTARAGLDDQNEEIARLRDEADRAVDELEKLQSERDLGESVGLGKGREARLVSKLEEEVETLKVELEDARAATADIEELEEQINQLRDKYAASQIDLERRDEEILDLNNEMDLRVREHEREINQVEAEWRDEVLETRGQVDELKDVMQEREAEIEDLRKGLLEREDELAGAREQIMVLEAAQGETHDRLEETLRGIQIDNEKKEADLLEANREVESLGQRVYELEELVDELRAREGELAAELQRMDDEKENYDELVTALKEARRKIQDERDDYASRLARAEEAFHSEREAWEKSRQREAEHHERVLATKDQVTERLTTELEAARDRVAMRDRDLVSVQNALRSLEAERRKLGDELSSDQRSLELEIERLRRDLARAEDDLDRAREEARERESSLAKRDMQLAELMDKHRSVERQLTDERQGRLQLSDKLDAVTKTARQHEREAETLRSRIEDIEPLLTESRNSRALLQRQNDQQRQERTDLLLRVFKDVNRFLAVEDSTTPANFTLFKDTLLSRLRSISGVRTDFDKRIRETEARMESKMASLKRQLEGKWRALDGFEASVKKLELARAQWRARLASKDGELESARGQISDLKRQLSSASSSRSPSDETIKLLTDRASMAEKRATQAAQSLESLERKFEELQKRTGSADTKWEARVKEYENRLRIAGEKVKAEKQGGKERAQQLETQVKELERQLELTRRHNRRAEGVVANAAHLLKDDE